MASERLRNRRVAAIGYALPGLVTWAVVVATVVGLLFYRRAWLIICAAFFVYFVARMAVTLVFAAVADLQCRRWGRTDWTAGEEVVSVHGFAASDVHHVVIVPTYREPADVLHRTLAGIAAQHRASERVIAVLATEEREPGARDKASPLAEEYAPALEAVLVTSHPEGLEGEIPGKAANQTWAARAARAKLDELGIPPERVTITSCDADSVLHPRYLAAVAHLFAADPHPHSRFWQAPVLYYNNAWDVPAPIRFTTWWVHANQLAELAMPSYEPLPLSTYTLSLVLAEKCGWWDPMVIPEDWHEYLNCMFETGGDVRLSPVFLPVSGDATDGDGWFTAILNRFRQLTRHAWGAEDVGFILGMMMQTRGKSRRKAIFRFAQVFHDHVFRSVTWFFVTSAYLLSVVSLGAQAARYGLPQPLLGALFQVGAVVMAGTALLEVLRNPPKDLRGLARLVPEVALMWLLLPAIGFVFGMLPALSAQTRLMLGLQMSFRVTPKRMPEGAAA